MIETEKCPDCGSHSFFLNKHRGEVICKECSFVIDEAMIDFGNEQRSFDEESGESSSRSGAPFDPRIADNLSTTVGNFADLSKLSGRNKAIVSRIRKRNTWASTAFEQNIKTAMAHMRAVSGRLNLPERVEKEAALIYRNAASKRLSMRRPIEHLVVATLYVASKLHGIPRPMKEFAEVGKMDMKILGKTYKMVMNELNIQIVPMNPVDYIGKVASLISLSPKTYTKTVKLIEQLKKAGGASGLSPLSIVATTIYLACQLENERHTQREIAQAAGITETTLRNRAESMRKMLGMKKRKR